MKNENIDFPAYPSSDYLFRVPRSYHHCTLQSFEFAEPKHAALVKHFLDNAEADRRGLFISGFYGVGKTHLLVALYRVILARIGGTTDCLFQTFDSMMHLLYSTGDSVFHKGVRDYISLFCDYEWLFLDDITTQPLHLDYQKEVLRQIINGRHESKKITCITANGSLGVLAEAGHVHPHAISRLMEMCVEIEIKGGDRRGRRNSE